MFRCQDGAAGRESGSKTPISEGSAPVEVGEALELGCDEGSRKCTVGFGNGGDQLCQEVVRFRGEIAMNPFPPVRGLGVAGFEGFQAFASDKGVGQFGGIGGPVPGQPEKPGEGGKSLGGSAAEGSVDPAGIGRRRGCRV